MTDPDHGDGREKPTSSSDDANLSARLKALETQLDKREAAQAKLEPATRATSNSGAIGQAFRLSAEFVSGVVAGGIIGWLVDRFAGTSPWGLVVCIILGFCAGMLNLMRSAGMVKPSRFDEKN